MHKIFAIFSPIHHTFAPLADTRQCLRALGMLLCPHVWNNGRSEEKFARSIGEAFAMDAFLFSSGRESLLALLRAMQLQPGEEVIVQGYTCVVVANAVRAAGGTPVFADIEKETLNLDLVAVEAAVTDKTRAVICQHTFGIPSDMEALRALCDDKNLALIEDCAHVLPDDTGPKAVGTKGDFLLLSFGRDKAVSGVSGGAVLSRHPYVSGLLFKEWQNAVDLPRGTTFRLLLYPWIYAVARPLYGLWVGKALLALCGMLGLLVPILSENEKTAGTMPAALKKMPNALTFLALGQWKRRRVLNDHRRMLTKRYLEACAQHGWPVIRGIREDLPLQKFPLFIPDADTIRAKLKAKNMILDDGWTGCVVCPPTVNQEAAGYTRGADPKAEKAAEAILSLPTHPTMEAWQADRLIAALVALPLLPPATIPVPAPAPVA